MKEMPWVTLLRAEMEIQNGGKCRYLVSVGKNKKS